MKSRSEILDKWLLECHEDKTLHFDTIGKIEAAMEEYAQQFASHPPAQGESADEIIKRINPDDRPTLWTDAMVKQAMHEYRNQPPAGNLWEEVDAVKEPPVVDGVYRAIDKDGEIHTMRWNKSYQEWFWLSGSPSGNDFIKAWLRPVTGQRYSEEDIQKAVDFGFRQCKLQGYISPTQEQQFIQSLNKK